MVVQLYPHQTKAVEELSDGKVLVGGVGTGKTITSLAYFYTKVMGGELNKPETITNPMDLYIFTTARKRDELDWQRDAAKLSMSRDPEASIHGITVTVDSYNNIAKYKEIKGAFVILDEQRMVGTGTWVKSFLKIAKSNRWIMLSATPGDKWEDYIPLFIANGFVKNITEFRRNHIVYSSYTKYPKVERYLQTGQLLKWRRQLLVEMPYSRHTVRQLHNVVCQHDVEMMRVVMEKRWHPIEMRPLRDIGEMFAMMRRVAYSDLSRKAKVLELLQKHPKLIVFYNFDYELEILRTLADDLKDWKVAEWNGHKHEPVPSGDRWVYLVQYVAGAEAWNCVETDAICFYSQTYSYRNFEQAQGRIDRLNTRFKDLHYYILTSTSMIDKAISKALQNKESFNESALGVTF
ncbi:DNA helicase [Gordonia phage Hydrus]|nr:DNA helicase [Gordonia phage Hydrus]